MLQRVICLLLGYFAGSLVQAGFWIGKFNHIDIREHGSGNAGTTNTMRTLGKKAGFLTYFLDMFKAVLVAIIIHFVYGNNTGIAEMILILYGGFGVVLGHNFPFYLKFKGGKGIAATSGVVISLFLFPKYCFLFTLLGISTFALVVIISKYVSLGSLVGIAGFFIEFVIWGQIGFLPIPQDQLIESYVVVFLFAALGFIRHSGNISRLIKGTERKIGEKKNNG
ncbi:MAG: glycerol-3-phosphate 1-O-acyltransferase PlsY [Eubacteriales bacterium]|nr:glycerol-3-phosphate 1-O-acyltransferase PlsY [Eubacteriales bacterium]